MSYKSCFTTCRKTQTGRRKTFYFNFHRKTEMPNTSVTIVLAKDKSKHTRTRTHIRFTHLKDKHVLNVVLLKWYT